MSRAGNQIPTPIPKHHINDPPLPAQGTRIVPFEGQSELSSAAVLRKRRASAGGEQLIPESTEALARERSDPTGTQTKMQVSKG